MLTYAIRIWANPGICGEDDQGNPWSTFSFVNGTVACGECGVEIDGGYVRGRWGEERLYVCGTHMNLQLCEQAEAFSPSQESEEQTYD